mmetsp:Transcript_2942/g.3312  ORF Transcript_2942/g.3312 Transcript_2942/m.3312 type:complete len:105 (+) Transcript_2942:58-372(+)
MVPRGDLLSSWASSFQDVMPPKPEPVVGDSLPLDIHVIIKKASGGIGGVQVTKPSTTGGLTPDTAAAAAPAPKAAASLVALPRCPLQIDRDVKGRRRTLISQFL